MHKGFLETATMFLAIAVALGAFGAHVLKDKLVSSSLAVFETGVKYQFYHAFGILACGILYKEFNNRKLLWASRLFIAGIIIFSGSLYALALLLPNYSFLGAITPLGGLSFIGGWLLLFGAFVDKK